jgi:hypothetical protein
VVVVVDGSINYYILIYSKVCSSKIYPASSSSDMPWAEGSRVL